MLKTILVFLILTLSLFGMSYQNLKKHAQKHAKVLQNQALLIASTKKQNEILLRTKNPSLSLETSRFQPDIGSAKFGYAITASQIVRTGGYFNAQKDIANASLALQKAQIIDSKSIYLKNLDLLYTNYVYQEKMFTLMKEEFKLSLKITNMIKQRYLNGSQTKVDYLQARTTTFSLKSQISLEKQKKNRLYYQLLSSAGISKAVSLNKNFIFNTTSKRYISKKANSKKRVLLAKQKVLQNTIKLQEHTFKSYEIYGGLEQEPSDTILRVGVSIDLPIFNQNKEERQLTKLKLQQLSLETKQLDLDIELNIQRLKQSLRTLQEQYQALISLKKEQKQLYNILKEGYNISNGSIFMLMHAKNRLIQTQKSILNTQKLLNAQQIELNFIQGAYND